jgi:hypothetical protein
VKLILAAIVLAAALVQCSYEEAHSQAPAYGPVVCHYGWHCHQWRTITPAGKSYVQVHERRHAVTPLSAWSPWRVVRVS